MPSHCLTPLGLCQIYHSAGRNKGWWSGLETTGLDFPQDINSEHVSKIREDLLTCSRQSPGQTLCLYVETYDLGVGVQLYPCGKTVDLSRLKKTCHTSDRVSTSFTLHHVEIRGVAPIPHPRDRGKGRKQAGCHQGKPEAAIILGCDYVWRYSTWAVR